MSLMSSSILTILTPKSNLMNIRLAEKIVELALKSDSKSKAEVDPNFRKEEASIRGIDSLTILKLVIENADQFVDINFQATFKQATIRQYCRDVFY